MLHLRFFLIKFVILGVLEAYYTCLNRVQLYGPTNFAPVINHVAKFAMAHRSGDKYFVLLILTDGIITDMPMTKEVSILLHVLYIMILVGHDNFFFW